MADLDSDLGLRFKSALAMDMAHSFFANLSEPGAKPGE